MKTQLIPGPRGLVPAPAIVRARTVDNFYTFDAATIDSTGTFLAGELERVDQRINAPLVDFTWSRDIDLREDVTIADENTSFMNSNFASAGGLTPGGKAWVGKDTTTITGLALDVGKTINPLTLWAMELAYTLPELASSVRVGRPIDSMKYEGIRLKHQMDIDEQVYIGDSVLGYFGLTNLPGVSVTNAANGAGGQPSWATKTPQEILADINGLIYSSWLASGWTRIPTELRVPPQLFGYLVANQVTNLGTQSIIEYLRANSLTMAQTGSPIRILPLKWLVGRGVGATNRIMVYTKDQSLVRFPMVPLQRTPIENRALHQLTYYYGRLGVVETPYPETLAYMDGV